jgi:hypothetical protein
LKLQNRSAKSTLEITGETQWEFMFSTEDVKDFGVVVVIPGSWDTLIVGWTVVRGGLPARYIKMMDRLLEDDAANGSHEDISSLLHEVGQWNS